MSKNKDKQSTQASVTELNEDELEQAQGGATDSKKTDNQSAKDKDHDKWIDVLSY